MEIGQEVSGQFIDDERFLGKIVAIDLGNDKFLIEIISGREDGSTHWFPISEFRTHPL